MTRLTRDRLESLASSSGVPHTSIYMPTEQAGDQVQQNPIRYKNRLKQAENDLKTLGFPANEINEHLNQARDLAEQYDFWQHQLTGLTVLIHQDQFETFRLTDDVPNLTVVSDRFHLKPLIPATSGQDLYYVLALAEGGVELYRGGRQGVELITLEDGPHSLGNFLQWDDPETELQWHTGTGRLDVQRLDPGVGLRGSIFHGHGAGAEAEVETENLLRFLTALNKAVYDMLAGDGDPPLVLLGSKELTGHYQKANSYSNLMEESVHHVPNELGAAEIHKLTYARVADHFKSDRQQAYQRFHEIEEGRSTVDLGTTLSAAKAGQVELVFLTQQDHRWGTYDDQDHSIKILATYEPGAVDLLDLAATETIINGGRVFLVDAEQMPGDEPVAAVLRYAIS